MSLKSSEDNYKQAKSLYSDIGEDFYEIENNSEIGRASCRERV